MLCEYAYLLKPGGRIYTITDVEELGQWHHQKLAAHPLFRQLSPEECSADPCVEIMTNSTEEGLKVTRKKGQKYYCVFERK